MCNIWDTRVLLYVVVLEILCELLRSLNSRGIEYTMSLVIF